MRTPRTAAGQVTADPPAAATEAPGAPPSGAARLGSLIAAPRRGSLIAAARRHWLVSALLLAGLVLRLLAQLAYRPALLYIDSVKYLYNAWPGSDPVGYKVPLKVILTFGNLETVTAVQHLLGLAMAVTIYAVLLRRGTARWLAALAVAPVLLDAYQLQIEQTIMPDVWFEALIVAGLALLLWRPRPATLAGIAAGVALGSSATIRQVGEIFVFPAAIYAVVTAGGLRRAIRAAVALCAAFALPIVVYSGISYALNGHFQLSHSGSSGVYGRMAEAADCASLNLPADERVLCPTAGQKALGPDGLEHSASSPLNLFTPPPGVKRSDLVSSFNRAVLIQQPLNAMSGFVSDGARLFAVVRVTSQGDTPISRWQFQSGYPTYGQAISLNRDHVIVVGLKAQVSGGQYSYQTLAPSMGGPPAVIRPLAAFLRFYQLHGGYTPGPLYALFALTGLAGSLALARRRASPADRQLALACLLFYITAAAVLLASDLFEFSWRYQLPALVTLAPAGALGIAVVLRAASNRDASSAGQGGSAQVPEFALLAGHAPRSSGDGAAGAAWPSGGA